MDTKWILDKSGKPFIEMVKIPAGKFVMGDNASAYKTEKPEREVYLHDYWIGKYPITNRQFARFLEESGYEGDGDFLRHWETAPGGSKCPSEEILDHPVTYVNWKDACAFCKFYGLTLPSEAQWEKAARGSDKRTYPWGEEAPDRSKPRCNFGNIFGGTTPVGLFDGTRKSYGRIQIDKGTSPNGVEDMAGNVWEWCLDEWDSEWLENMGESPVDPCNFRKKERIRPFPQTEDCTEDRGSVPMTSTCPNPFTVDSINYAGSAAMVSEDVSKEAEEEIPFPCEEVRGTRLSPTSMSP